MEQVLEYFEMGYKVYVGSYYGDQLLESAEEIKDCWEEAEEDGWLYIDDDVEVDDEEKKVIFFVGNDE